MPDITDTPDQVPAVEDVTTHPEDDDPETLVGDEVNEDG